MARGIYDTSPVAAELRRDIADITNSLRASKRMTRQLQGTLEKAKRDLAKRNRKFGGTSFRMRARPF